jgi:hypothetical protein
MSLKDASTLLQFAFMRTASTLLLTVRSSLAEAINRPFGVNFTAFISSSWPGKPMLLGSPGRATMVNLELPASYLLGPEASV